MLDTIHQKHKVALVFRRCDNGSDILTISSDVPSSARGSGQWVLLERLCSSRLSLPPRLMGGPGARIRLELTTAVLPHHLRESTTTQSVGGNGAPGTGGKKGAQRGIGGSGFISTRRPTGFQARYRFVNGTIETNVCTYSVYFEFFQFVLKFVNEKNTCLIDFGIKERMANYQESSFDKSRLSISQDLSKGTLYFTIECCIKLLYPLNN